MSDKPDGGQAFPSVGGGFGGSMSMRQWYAGNAPEIPKAMLDYIGNPTDIARVIANWRYIYADAMIAEGEK